MSALCIYSGTVLQGRVGDKTNLVDSFGNYLAVGDIVALCSGDEVCPHRLTAVVDDRYTSYSDGSVVDSGVSEPFIMGIKSVPGSEWVGDDPAWVVIRVKRGADCVDGERWPQYGFSYRANETVEAEKAA